MKALQQLQRGRRRTATRGFTLTEVLVAMAIFTLMIGALVTTQIMGLKLYRISETKLRGTAECREALNTVRDEIRMGKILVVGNGNASAFIPIPDNEPQIGNALQIYPTTNLTVFVRYFLDVDSTALMRSGDGEVRMVANYITNHLVFRAEDFMGTVLTNNQNNRVIRMTLEFYQWEYPIASVGSDGMYDYYRLQTRVTRRTIE